MLSFCFETLGGKSLWINCYRLILFSFFNAMLLGFVCFFRNLLSKIVVVNQYNIDYFRFLTPSFAFPLCGCPTPHPPLTLNLNPILLHLPRPPPSSSLSPSPPSNPWKPCLAFSNGHANLCVELVKRGATVSAINASNYTPLHWAAYKVRISRDVNNFVDYKYVG